MWHLPRAGAILLVETVCGMVVCQLVLVQTLSGGEPGILLREPEICARAVRGWIQKLAARIHETRVIGDQGKVQSEIMHVVCV